MKWIPSVAILLVYYNTLNIFSQLRYNNEITFIPLLLWPSSSWMVKRALEFQIIKEILNSPHAGRHEYSEFNIRGSFSHFDYFHFYVYLNRCQHIFKSPMHENSLLNDRLVQLIEMVFTTFSNYILQLYLTSLETRWTFSFLHHMKQSINKIKK